MVETLRILMLEDVPEDAEIAVRVLRRDGMAFTSLRVETREGFLSALRDFHPHVILADYSLPSLTGHDALGLVFELAPTTPVLIVTGSLSEETAADCIKAGAVDYVLKERIARLPSAIRSALGRRRMVEEKARADEALRASEQRYRTLFTHSRDGIFIADAATERLLDANAALLEMSGYSMEQVRDTSLLALVPQEYVAAARTAWTATARGGTLGALEIEFLRADGTRLPVEIRASAYTDADGAVRLFGVVRDSSERRRREKELRASEQRHRALFEEARDAIFIADPATGMLLDANRAAQALVGRTAEEVRRMHQSELHPPEERDAARASFAREASKPDRRGIRLNVQHRDGRRTPVEISGTTMDDETGRPLLVGVFRDVSERRASEAAARESAERFRRVVEGAPEALFTWADGTITYINPAALRLLGASAPEEFIGKPAIEVVSPEYREMVRERMRSLVETGAPSPPAEEMFVRVDGTPFTAEVTPVAFPHGDLPGGLVFFRDVTQHIAAEQALRESELRYRQVVESGPEALFTSVDGRLTYVNPAAVQLFGATSAEDLRDGSALDRISPAFHALARERAEHLIATGEPNPLTVMLFVRLDGTTFDVELRSVPFPSEGRRGMLTFFHDISSRVAAEQALRESEERFRQVVEGGPEALFTSADMRFTYVNPAALQLFGATAATELVGRPTLERISAESHALVRERLERLLVDGTPTPRAEQVFTRVDGTTFDVEVHSVAFPHEGHKGVLTFFRDITERKRAVEELALLSTALSQAGEVAVITDTSGVIQYVNPAFERVTGYSAAEAIGKNPRVLKSGVQGPEVYRRMWDSLTAGQVFTGTFVNRRKNGDHYVAEVVVSPVRDSAGKVVRYVGLQRDVTHEHDLEEQLRQSQKMEAVGQLTGGIAHDFNNLLGVILANASLLGAALKDQDAELWSYLADIEQAAEAGSGMVKKLLAFGRRERLTAAPLDLVKALREMEHTLRRFLPETIAVRVDADEPGPGALADAGALEQMLLNLATNARDAMPGGGTLTIGVSEVEFRDEDAQFLQGLDRPGQYACLSVSDTGVGMDAATLERVFEPFFTTKPPGAGTGLGMPMVFGLMKQHGGFVRVYSEPGRGTTVRLYFPTAVTAAERRRSPVPALKLRGDETILVVEDQEMLRRATARALEKIGYQILVAADGEEGLRMLAANPGRVRLVLSDRVMPELGGVEMYQRLRAEGHPVPFLLMSGYAADAGGITPVPKELPVIEKPWTVESLASRIRELLDAPPPA